MKDYYENDKERLKEQARDKYRNLSEKDKNKKRAYGRNRYRDMFEENKQKKNTKKTKGRLKEYQKITVRLKSLNLIINIFYGFNSVCRDLIIRY